MASREIRLIKTTRIKNIIFCIVLKKKCIKHIRILEKNCSSVVRIEINERQSDSPLDLDR